MFALEIHFTDGATPPETVFIRRPQALLGAHDFAHVAIDDMKSLGYQLRLVRDVGRTFRLIPVGIADDAPEAKQFDRIYEGTAELNLGPITLLICALDVDLMVRDGEEPDRAGVRVVRSASATSSPLFPAVVILGAQPTIVSFGPDQTVLIGRSRGCALRLDASDISGQHARMGYEQGEFWIEDLGSTNGTFVRQQQIAGRVRVLPGEQVILGREVAITGVASEDQIRRGATSQNVPPAIKPSVEARYPALVATSESVRPARISLVPGHTVAIGRDPTSDMWLGAPHISRVHCAVMLRTSGVVTISDLSTNGTYIEDQLLGKNEVLELQGVPRVLDFGGDITVAVCYSAEDEAQFQQSQGHVFTFSPERQLPIDSEESEALVDGESIKDTGIRGTGSWIDGASALHMPKPRRFSPHAIFALGAVSVLVVIFIVVSLLNGLATR